MTGRRNVATGAFDSSGRTLLAGALDGDRATGFDNDDEWLLLDAEAPVLVGADTDDLADRWIFSGNRPLVRDVTVAGVRVVEDGRHRYRDAIAARYREAMRQLLA